MGKMLICSNVTESGAPNFCRQKPRRGFQYEGPALAGAPAGPPCSYFDRLLKDQILKDQLPWYDGLALARFGGLAQNVLNP